MVCDVGGGNGHATLSLAKTFPNLCFVVQDLEHVVQHGKPVSPFLFVWLFRLTDTRSALGKDVSGSFAGQTRIFYPGRLLQRCPSTGLRCLLCELGLIHSTLQ